MRKWKKMVALYLCTFMCICLNVNPLCMVASGLVESGLLDRFTNLKNNLLYLAEYGFVDVALADAKASTSVSFQCDAMEAAAMLSGSIEKVRAAIQGGSGTDLVTCFGVLNGTQEDIIEELKKVNDKLDDIYEELTKVNENIDQMQHNYRVGHLYSLNNSMKNALWRPYSEDVPYLKDLATVTGKFANVYTGYWDSSVTTLTNTNIGNGDNFFTRRAYEILGYDSIICSEGLILTQDVGEVKDSDVADGGTGQNQGYAPKEGMNTHTIVTLYQEYIPEDEIRWIDAVTLLYKALGQEQVSYQSFLSWDGSITPETSPAYQGLSNPIPDEKTGKYQGYDLYMFFTRANIISKDQAMSGNENINAGEIDYIYWQKAVNAGFIPSEFIEKPRESIDFSSFMILATKMMQAYGEPVMNNDELKALLQVYGAHYPIQLGAEVADSWAYLAARGIFDFSEFVEGEEALLYDFSCTDYITRDQLLTMCMRIKDIDSRTDYKEISVTLDLSDAMKDDFFYPVNDLEIVSGEFSAELEYDHSACDYYDYLIQCNESTSLGEAGIPTVYTDEDCTDVMEGSSVETSLIEIDGNNYYHVTVPKDYKLKFYLSMFVVTDDDSDKGGKGLINNAVTKIEIPASGLGGGYFTGFTIQEDTAIANTSDSHHLLFDDRNDDACVYFTDYKRAGNEKPAVTEAASNATVLEEVMAIVDYWTTPTTAFAKKVKYKVTDGNDIRTLSIRFKGGTKSDEYKGNLQDESAFTSTSKWVGGGVSTDGVVLNTVNHPTLKYGSSVSIPFIKTASGVNIAGGNLSCQVYNSCAQAGLALDRMTYLTYLLEKEGLETTYPMTYYGVLKNNKLRSAIKNYINDTSQGSTLWNKVSNDTGCNSIIGDRYTYNQYNFGVVESFLFGVTANNNGVSKLSLLNTAGVEFSGVKSDEVDKEKILSVFDNLFTTKQNRQYSKWIRKGLCNVKKVGNGWDITGKKKSIDTIIDNLGDTNELRPSDNGELGDVSDADFETTVTSSVMNREEQILILWDDLVEQGLCFKESGDTSMPEPTNNGVYYFRNYYGEVKVNPQACTIQIGTTLYDLYNENGKSPTLVYVTQVKNEETGEEESKLYFDYRCVMGVVQKGISRSETKTETVEKALGSGAYAVYDFGSDNQSNNDIYNVTPINCYNYPDINGTPCASDYDVDIITSTQYDSANAVSASSIYWDGNDNMSRFKLNSFVPTANWVTVIDDNGNDNITANLYVYYLRTAFDDGYVEVDGTPNLGRLKAPDNFEKIYNSECTTIEECWKDIAGKVVDASSKYQGQEGSLTSVLKNVYGYDVNDVDTVPPWYIQMTYEAVARLFEDTNGKYFLSKDYVIRRFDISVNSISSCRGWGIDADGNNPEVSTNDPGAIYWCDYIGYVYNMPKVSEWKIKDYLYGKYPLPLAVKSGNTLDKSIYNFNINYYGDAVKKDRHTKNRVPYGVVLDSKAKGYITLNGDKYEVNNSSGAAIALCGAEYKSDTVLPFAVKSAKTKANYKTATKTGKGYCNYMIPAPTAIYFRFSANELKVKTLEDASGGVGTDNATYYYGSSRIRYIDSDINAPKVNFKIVSEDFAPIKVNKSATVYEVYRSAGSNYPAYILDTNNIHWEGGSQVDVVNVDDMYTNSITDWLEGLGAMDLIASIDAGASFVIIFAFKVMPWIGIILMTILIGLSFISEVKLVQIICDKTIDPVRILTFGGRDIYHWNWRKVLIPCIILYVSFALFLNGNLIRIVQWGAEWYGVVMRWLKS